VLVDSDYEGVVGLLTKVIAGRFGSGLGTFFFGFLTSRFPLSLFPMPYSMPQFLKFATAARVHQSEWTSRARLPPREIEKRRRKLRYLDRTPQAGLERGGLPPISESANFSFDGGKISPRWEGLMKLTYVLKFVDNMDRAVKFHRDVLALPLKFESPEWSEFSTGETTLALHRSSAKNAAGSVELGFTVPDLHKFHADMTAKGVQFTMPPTKQDFGGELAQFVDSEGGRNSVGQG
jgi:predicted enzyme related to lactoylglutathione lyase